MRPWVLVGTKIDAVAERDEARAALEEVSRSFGVRWLAISAVTGEGVKELLRLLFDLVEEARDTP
jgi:50S ribosomal subunit-associated GTPase HflX